MRAARVLVPAFVAGLSLGTTPASAATRLAAPFTANTSGTCLAEACRLDHAIAQASPGDVVALADGPYSISYQARATRAITIQPATPGTQPRLIGQANLAYPTLE